jgi:hypothetical protein
MITPYNILAFAIGAGFGIVLVIALMRFKAWDIEEENTNLKNENYNLRANLKLLNEKIGKSDFYCHNDENVHGLVKCSNQCTKCKEFA